MKEYISNPFQNYRNVTGSRALDTAYTNDTGRVMLVFVTLDVRTTAANGTAKGIAQSPSGSNQSQYGMILMVNGSRTIGTVTAIVNPGASYKVLTEVNNGVVAMTEWTELF